MLDKIGKNALINQSANDLMSNIGSPNSSNTTIFTNHQPLSVEMLASFTVHVRIHLANYLVLILTQKINNFKILSINIPASIVETFARILIFDPDNFIKYFTRY